jgi:serine beta-lactamase-like protein LACTB, mitochondrial
MSVFRPGFASACWSVIRSALLLLAGCLTTSAAEDLSSPALAEAIKQVRTMIAKDAAKVPGLAVAVAYDGKVVWSEGFGYADLETKQPVSPATTRFRIASVSKPLTAAGLMRLVERGLVDLDAPVQQYVPDFPVKQEGVITTRLLAGHLAGIRHYKWLEPFRNEPFANVQAGLAIFKNDPLVSPPGAEFHYTTYGYSLISAVMESAAQRGFLDYMQSEVFAPLGMNNTRPDRAGVLDTERTQFYKGSLIGGYRLEGPIDSSYKWAGGGFLSTAEDMVIFGSALLQPGFLKEESLAQLFTPQKAKGGKPSSYGIGWGVAKNRKGRTFYLHSGAQQGSTSFLLIRPEARIAVAILCNISNASLLGQKDPMLLAKCFDGLTTPSPETK